MSSPQITDLRITDWSDAQMHCQLATDVTWVRESGGEGAPAAGLPWASFAVKGLDGWQLEVTGCYLTREINTDDWLLIQSEKNGETFDGFASANNGYVLRTELAGGRFAVTSACKDHNRLLMARAVFPRPVTQTAAFPQVIASVGSLQFIRPTFILSAEPLVFVMAATRVPFRFSLPSSWICVHKQESRESAGFAVQHMQEGNCLGRIEVQVGFNGGSVDELLAEELERLVTIPAKLGSGPVFGLPARDGFHAGKAMTIPIEVNGELAEASLIVIAGHDAAADVNVSIRLIGPVRPDGPEAWALNKRALEIVYASTGMGDLVGPPGAPQSRTTPSSASPIEDATSLATEDIR
jgi:hypothetical protein